MYTPSYLQWLDSQPSRIDGYPEFLSDQDIKWLEVQVVHCLQQYEEQTFNPPINDVAECWITNDDKPKNLQLLGWNAIHGITYRALLSVADARWKLRK